MLESDYIIPAIYHIKKKKGDMSQFTRTEFQKRADWDEWNKSKMTQLDNYATQDMFEDPIPRPANVNVLRLLWTYLVKSDGTRNASCVMAQPRAKALSLQRIRSQHAWNSQELEHFWRQWHD